MNKRVYILLENVVISSVYLSVQHLAPADYVKITFNRNETNKKMAVMVRAVQNTQN